MRQLSAIFMKQPFDFFPSKLAKGEQFCNRLHEQESLKRNIELARHTVLVSPRRYGKSSLVHYVAAATNITFESIDLFLAHNNETVTRRILVGISNVICKLAPTRLKAAAIAKKYFNNFKASFNASGFGLELSRSTSLANPIDQIFEALRSLAHLAKEKKQKVLFFIDEFQDLTNAESSKAIQGAIRHVAQDTSWIVFLFSGSNRHLLLNLFDDQSNPLYMLCDKLLLDRMSSFDYHPHIQKAAQIRWGSNIDAIVLNRIMTLTELHPFYVNLLCNELWKNNKDPTIGDVSAAWHTCYTTEERRLVVELERLTSNQQDILKALALEPIYEPSGQKFLSLLKLPLSSTRIGIKTLLEKDLIYIVKKEDPNLPGIKKGQYRVLDPLLGLALRKYA